MDLIIFFNRKSFPKALYIRYIHDVYTRGIYKVDLFDATILCEKCNKKAKDLVVHKDGLKIRAKVCPSCGKKWYHPLDMQEYKEFEKLKDKDFNVKLRMIGNSFCVSIPREIIDFQEEMMKELNEMIRMNLESPERLTLYFRKKLRRR